MQEVEVTFFRAAQVWWAWLWRSMLLALLLGFITGVMIGLVASIAGFTQQEIMPLSSILGAIIGLLVSIWIMSKMLKKNFGSFRIALLKN